MSGQTTELALADQIAPVVHECCRASCLERRSDQILDLFHRVTPGLFWYPGSDRRRSTLTADGFPIEFSLSLRKGEAAAFRYGLDPGDLRLALRERTESVEWVIGELFQGVGCGSILSIHRDIRHRLLLDSGPHLDSIRFATWIGAAHRKGHPDRAKVYYNLQPLLAASRGRDVFELVHEHGFDARHAQSVLAGLPNAELALLGMDYGKAGLRCKLYARLREPDNAARLAGLWSAARNGRQGPVVADVFSNLPSGQALPPSSVMLSLAGSHTAPLSPALFFDLRRLTRSDRQAASVVVQVAAAVGCDINPYLVALRALRGSTWQREVKRHTLLGVSDRGRDLAVTIYFRPALSDLALLAR